MISAVELRMKRIQTAEYIRAESSLIILTRPIFTKTLSGGLARTGQVPLPAKEFRMVPFVKRLTKMTRDTPDGNIFNISYALIGLWDADVMEHDEFTHNDTYYQVISIEPNRADRTAAHVIGHGRPHGNAAQ